MIGARPWDDVAPSTSTLDHTELMIDACPRCGYSLQGLPCDHNCPECGLRYDAQSAVYRVRDPKAVFGAVGGGTGWLWGGVALFDAYRTVPRPWRVLIILFWIIYLLETAWLMRFFYFLFKAGPLVAVVSDGLFVRLRRLEGELIPWSNIARAAANKNMKSAVLFIRDTKTIRDVAGVFRGPLEVEQFAAQVNARAAACP